MQFMIQCFQNYYPESLGKCLVVNPPWIFSGFYRMIRPLLDPVVAAKVEMISPGPEMFKFVEPDNLLEPFGGLSKYQYRYVPAEEGQACIRTMTSEEMLVAEDQIEDFHAKLVDITIAINGLLINGAADVDESDPSLNALLELRDGYKASLRALWAMVDASIIPTSHYHRIGVLGQDSQVSWPSI